VRARPFGQDWLPPFALGATSMAPTSAIWSGAPMGRARSRPNSGTFSGPSGTHLPSATALDQIGIESRRPGAPSSRVATSCFGQMQGAISSPFGRSLDAFGSQ
jgi:hypothetical protein